MKEKSGRDIREEEAENEEKMTADMRHERMRSNRR